MKYWAWLTTSAKGANQARMESIVDPKMPKIAPFDYLIALVAEIGLSGVSWSDIYHWVLLSGTNLRLWEIQQIKKLSMMYHNSAQQYEGTSIPSPYRDVDMVSQEPINHLRTDKV